MLKSARVKGLKDSSNTILNEYKDILLLLFERKRLDKHESL